MRMDKVVQRGLDAEQRRADLIERGADDQAGRAVSSIEA
jgi:hypothetical protein